MNHCPDCDDSIPEWAERCVNCTEEHELSRRLEAERRNYEHFFMDPVNAEPLPPLSNIWGFKP